MTLATSLQAEPAARTKVFCEFCGTSLNHNEFGIAWSKAWFDRGSLNNFYVTHIPYRHHEQKPTSDFACVDTRGALWCSLTDVLDDPPGFLELIKASPIVVSERACKKLMAIFGQLGIATGFDNPSEMVRFFNGDL